MLDVLPPVITLIFWDDVMSADETERHAVSLTDRFDELLIRAERFRELDWLKPIAMIVFGCALMIAWVRANWFGSDGAVEDRIPFAVIEPAVESTVELPLMVSTTALEPKLVVHVSGAVMRPGLVELSGSARVADAVAAAGGSSPDADIHRLNLAARLIDGSQIVVPLIGEDLEGSLVRLPASSSELLVDGGLNKLVNLNTAGVDQLETLPGIGPSLAASIVQWRQRNGNFSSPEELIEVSGIGPAKLADLREMVTVG